jgi:hypothetical protein
VGALAKTKRKIRLPVVGITKNQFGIHTPGLIKSTAKAFLVGVNRNTREMQFEGLEKGIVLNTVFPDTPRGRYLLGEYLKAQNTIRGVERWRVQLRCPYGRIEANHYTAVITELEESYEAAKSYLESLPEVEEGVEAEEKREKE